MKVESERLILYPISDEELKEMMEHERDADLRQAYAEMLQGCLDQPENRIWYTAWCMELKAAPGTVVGDFCFKGLNPDGMVELGYGLREGYCGKGYMTEAVRTITLWAQTRDGVTRVESETDPDNVSSQRVLARAGYVPTGETGEEGPRYVYAGQAD